MDAAADNTNAASKFRPIELESADEMRILIANMTNAARSKIDVHMPVSSATANGEPDPLRARVEEMVTEYVHRTFNLARHSIAVNGLPAEPAETYVTHTETEEVEPLDRGLHDQVVEAYAAIEKATLELATLRREHPARAAHAFAEVLEKELAADNKILEELAKRQDEAAATPDGRLPGEIPVHEVDRMDEIVRSKKEAEENLKKLQTQLPATAAKLTRAGEALDYVLEKERRR